MKRILNVQELSQREVPGDLDARILGYARRKCATPKVRRRKLLWVGSSAAAAACLAVSAVLFWNGGEAQSSSLRRAELLAMSDFTQVSREGYNASFMLGSGSDVFQDDF